MVLEASGCFHGRYTQELTSRSKPRPDIGKQKSRNLRQKSNMGGVRQHHKCKNARKKEDTHCLEEGTTAAGG
jgi:hypothetical protein